MGPLRKTEWWGLVLLNDVWQGLHTNGGGPLGVGYGRVEVVVVVAKHAKGGGS